MRYLLFLFVFISSITLAQNGINYQGAATDSDGAKLVDQNISLRTSVLQGGVDGTTSYSETHNTTTDQFGLFNVVIGQGEVVSGDFEGISWGADSHFLKVELDATGGSDYSLVSTTKMMSVPYAKYAENSDVDISISPIGDTLFINQIALYIPGISYNNANLETVTDGSGNTYMTHNYGTAGEWMLEDLKTTHYNDGTPITGSGETGAAGSGYYTNVNGNIYDYYTAFNLTQNVCPVGWRIPTRQEWYNLISLYADTSDISDNYCNGPVELHKLEFNNIHELLGSGWSQTYLNISGFNIKGTFSNSNFNGPRYYTSDQAPQQCFIYAPSNYPTSFWYINIDENQISTGYNHGTGGNAYEIRCIKD